MRRLIAFSFGILLLAACGEMQDSTPMDVFSEVPEQDPGLPTSSEIYDGASGQDGANPHFYFFSPVAAGTPAYTGVADDELRPKVTICRFDLWSPEGEACTGDPLATFTMEPDDFGTAISLDPGVKYSVVWKTNNYPVEMISETESVVYRVAVSVAQVTLGWADVKGYDNQTYNSFQHTDPDGNVAISDNGNLNIVFRIEDGALEWEKCPGSESVEDCDVEVLSFGESACLKTFANPLTPGEVLGSQACVPANAAYLDDTPVEGDYAVILTLEKEDVIQGGPNPDIPDAYQIRYLTDVKTDPAGISFAQDVGGVDLVICQAETGDYAIPESLHPLVRPFLIFTSPSGSKQTVLPDNYFFGAPECEDFAVAATAHIHGQDGQEGSLLSRIAQGFSRVTSYFRPKPLVARRLHGGLNTTVYDTKGDAGPGGGEENVIAFNENGEVDYTVEAGGMIKVVPGETATEFSSFSGLEESEVTFSAQPFTIDPLTGASLIPLYDLFADAGEAITVEWWVEGANPSGSAEAPNQASGPDAEGIFYAAYTPTEPGLDYIFITVDGVRITDTPFTYEVLPLTGPIEVYVEISSDDPSAEPAPADGLPVKLYRTDGSVRTETTLATGTPGIGVATFDEEYSGSYVVYLPKRDFDVDFDGIQAPLDHSPNLQNRTSTVTLTGTSYPLPAGVEVFRIRESEGTGNAFEFVLDNRSWISAQNQIRDVTLRGVPAHLATIKSPEENAFVAGLVEAQCPEGSNTSKCSRAWIGLTDEEVDDTFVWVDGAYLNPAMPADPFPGSPYFFGWKRNSKGDLVEPSGRNNEDHVEIDLNGEWSDENGASSTNDGYITEYDAQQPPPDPVPGG